MKYVACVFLCFIFILSSCNSLDDINTDPNNPGEGQIDENYLWASYLVTMQRKVAAENVDDFQLSDDLFGNVYAGYMASTNNWEAGMNSTTYVFPDHWRDRPFKLAYTDFLSTWDALRRKVDSSSVVFAVGEIIKVQAMHRVTDMYGPIPYSKFGLVHPVPYDSQEDVYKSFFKELEHASYILWKNIRINSTSEMLEKYDLVYNGDLVKWARFANSLVLRLAIRMRHAEPALAKRTVERFASSRYGFIESNEDNALIQSNIAMHFNYRNPIYTLWYSYHDQCMGASMDSYLNGFKDPRLPKYFTPNSKEIYKGLRNGLKNGGRHKAADTSKPNILKRTPYYWMTAAEVYFLMAEAALIGWDLPNNGHHTYNRGIYLSMEQWKVNAEEIGEYISDFQINPDRYVAAKYIDPFAGHDIESPSPLHVEWNYESTDEENLERIITQKWIALYPNGQEAWSEYRRTGYPRIFPIIDNMSKGLVDTDKQVRRVPFPKSEHDGNSAEVLKAIQLLKGPDTGGTRLWWDAK